MRTQDLAVLVVFILIFRFECIRTVPAADDGLTEGLENRLAGILTEGLETLLAERQLLPDDLTEGLENRLAGILTEGLETLLAERQLLPDDLTEDLGPLLAERHGGLGQPSPAEEEHMLEELIERLERTDVDAGLAQNGQNKNLEISDDPSTRVIDSGATATEIQNNITAQHNKEYIIKITKKIAKELVNKIFEKQITKVKTKIIQQTSRILAKMAKKSGLSLVARLGVKAGKAAAKKAAALVAAKVTAKAGAQTAAASSTGPGFPFVMAAMLAFDVLSLGLDFGDAGGYMKTGTVANYLEIKAGVDAEIKKALEVEGGNFPSVTGPLDKLSDAEFEATFKVAIDDLMNLETPNPTVQKVMNAIESDLESKVVLESDINNTGNLDRYASLVEFNDVYNLACENNGGKVVDTDKGNKQCSYKDKTACDNSYSWPLAEDSTEIYVEYKSSVFGGSCVTASYALRSICESNKIPYDSETGICKIDEQYCKIKGLSWEMNEDIKQYDCKLPLGQKLAEMLFGTTITRGLKQIFDPDQYENCTSNEIDDGYFCRRISACPPGEEQWANGGICYPKCRQGYHPFGCCVCSPDCPAGFTDDGATCRRAGYCDKHLDHQGALCYNKCETGYNGEGPVCWKHCPSGFTDNGLFCGKGGNVISKSSRPADKRPCPAGMRDDGTSCWRDTYGRGAGRSPDKGACPAGLRDDGTSCWSDAHVYGKGCCCTIWGCCGGCRRGYADDGCTCRKTDVGIKVTLSQRQSCRSNEDRCLALCYPKCKPGYKNVGCNLCEPNEGPGIKVTLQQRQYCRSNENNVEGICWSSCPSGHTDDGALCRVPITTTKKESYGRGAGKPDTTIRSKSAAYGRGVGKSAVHIRPKKRVVPFSSKNNK